MIALGVQIKICLRVNVYFKAEKFFSFKKVFGKQLNLHFSCQYVHIYQYNLNTTNTNDTD